jgi:hypothetical protein
MVFSLSLDKTDFLYTERADNTDGSVKRRKKSVRSVKLVLTVALAPRVEVSVYQGS